MRAEEEWLDCASCMYCKFKMEYPYRNGVMAHPVPSYCSYFGRKLDSTKRNLCFCRNVEAMREIKKANEIAFAKGYRNKGQQFHSIGLEDSNSEMDPKEFEKLKKRKIQEIERYMQSLDNKK